MILIYLYPIPFNIVEPDTCIDGCWYYEEYNYGLVFAISELVYPLFVLKCVKKIFTNKTIGITLILG